MSSRRSERVDAGVGRSCYIAAGRTRRKQDANLRVPVRVVREGLRGPAGPRGRGEPAMPALRGEGGGAPALHVRGRGPTAGAGERPVRLTRLRVPAALRTTGRNPKS